MNEGTVTENPGPSNKVIEWKTFLETIPPYTAKNVENFCYSEGPSYEPYTPDLELYCSAENCNGIRFFEGSCGRVFLKHDKPQFFFLSYTCKNCGKGFKQYAIMGSVRFNNPGKVMKIGELPAFGPHIPSCVLTLVGPDRDLFLKGHRTESQGFGIGAYAYYRRIVENQKKRIIAEIKKVAEKTGASSEILKKFDEALQADQFSQSVDQVKDVVPESLLIEGHNPLELLHKALIGGIHDSDDKLCLESASSIRLVLTDLADRTDQLLKERSELKDILKKLLNSRSEKHK